jgi:hypothetical protein
MTTAAFPNFDINQYVASNADQVGRDLVTYSSYTGRHFERHVALSDPTGSRRTTSSPSDH